MKKILTSSSFGIFFIDTCILRQLNLFNNTLILPSQLYGLVKEGYYNIVIPKIVFEEYITQKTEHAAQSLQKINEFANEFAKYEITTTFKAPSNTRLLREKISKKVISILEESKISVISLPLPELSILVDMAINKKPPFKDRGRGFKDALILLSCIKALEKIPRKPAWLISKDGDFDHEGVQRLITSSKVHLECIKSIDQALEQANQHLNGITRKLLKKKEEKATDYVKEHEEELLKFTQKNLLTSRFATSELLQEQDQQDFEVRRIKSHQAKRLLTVTPDEDKKTKKVQLRCQVLVTVEIVVRLSYFSYHRRSLFSKIPIGEEKHTAPEAISLPPTPPTSVEAIALVQATADIVTALGDDNYKNIMFENAVLVGRSKR